MQAPLRWQISGPRAEPCSITGCTSCAMRLWSGDVSHQGFAGCASTRAYLDALYKRLRRVNPRTRLSKRGAVVATDVIWLESAINSATDCARRPDTKRAGTAGATLRCVHRLSE